MEVAKITNNSYISLSAALLRKFGLKDGDNLMVDEDRGVIYLNNSGMQAYEQVTEVFRGAAAEAGFETEEQMQKYMKEIRMEVRGY